MERLATRYHQNYSMLAVYRDDLERIVAIIKDNCEEVTIEAEGYKLSHISDLDQLQEKSHLETLSHFDVTGSTRTGDALKWTFLVVRLERGYLPSLSLSDASDTKLYGAATQIDAILSARRNKRLAAVTSNRVGLFSMLVCFAVIVFGLNQPWKLHPHPSPDAIPWLIVIIAFFLLGVTLPWVAERVRATYSLTVHLTDSHSHKQLTRAERKQIANGSVGFVLGVLSTVIGGLIVWLLTR